MSLVFAFLTITMLANQVATGLSLTIFGIGFSAYIGKPYTSAAVRASIGRIADTWSRFHSRHWDRAFFMLTPLGYLAFIMFGVIGWFLYKTRAGLVLRSVGESPSVAHSVGFPVVGVRYAATLFGGGMAGIAGGYYSIVYLHLWQEQLTSGRGWIALALVVFATWRPGRFADRRVAVRRRDGPAVLCTGDRPYRFRHSFSRCCRTLRPSSCWC